MINILYMLTPFILMFYYEDIINFVVNYTFPYIVIMSTTSLVLNYLCFRKDSFDNTMERCYFVVVVLLLLLWLYTI